MAAMLASSSAVAQSSLTGRVVNSEKVAISGVSVTCHSSPDGPIKSFALTQADGTYRIDLPAPYDTLYLYVAHLAYDEQGHILTAGETELNWALTERTFDLPVMEITKEPVVRRGDTLIFDTESLRQKNDETIEQVLARIPGITVKSNGKILYQDLPISKFYIEGLDLLDGRYAQATRNLRIDAIRDIEILERHQPIRVLDSLSRPPNAAINLRLRSKVAFVGSMELGAAGLPARYLAKATLFGFAKTQQISGTAGANTFGRRQRDDLVELYTSSPIDLPLVQPTRLIPPATLPTNSYLDNNERLGGTNYLRKVGDTGQLKFFVMGAADRTQYDGTRRQVLRNGTDNPVVTEERINLLNGLNSLASKVSYESNESERFLKGDLNINHSSLSTVGDHQLNGSPSAESFNKARSAVNLNGDGIFRRGKRTFAVKGTLDYVDTDLDLSVTPLPFSLSLLDTLGGSGALQTARQRSWIADVHTKLYFRKNRWSSATTMGLRGRWRRLASQLRTSAANSAEPTPTISTNNTRQYAWGLYVDLQSSYRTTQHNWNLSIPVAMQRLTIESNGLTIPAPNYIGVLRPSLEYIRRLTNAHEWTIRYGFAYDYQRDDWVYENTILLNRLQTAQRLPAINTFRQHKVTGRYRGSDRDNRLQYQLFIQLTNTIADFLPITRFDANGQTTQVRGLRNARRQLTSKLHLETQLFKQLLFSFDTRYQYFSQPLVLNDKGLSVNNQSFEILPRLSYPFQNSVFAISPQLHILANNLSDTPVQQAQLNASFFQQFSKEWGNLRVSLDLYQTRIGTRRINNQWMSVRYDKIFNKLKTTLSLQLDNLTNTPYFVTIAQQDFVEELTQFQLRNRQISVILKREF